MTVSLKHRFHSAQPDDPDATLIRPSNWNDEHNLTGTPGTSLGFDGSGNATETSPGGRTTITGHHDYYVATTGSDSNTGSVGSPWLTVQHAVNYVAANLQIAPNDFTAEVYINVADGTYTTTEGVVLPECPFMYNCTLMIMGNTTTPANVIFNTTNAFAVLWNEGMFWYVWGVTFDASGDSHASVDLINGGNGIAELFLNQCRFGKAGNAGTGSHVLVYANAGASCVDMQNITVAGIASCLARVKGESNAFGSIYIPHGSLTLSIDPLWPAGTFVLERFGILYFSPDGGVTGTSSGPKYTIESTGRLLLAGIAIAIIPGVAGTSINGGFIYDLTNNSSLNYRFDVGLAIGNSGTTGLLNLIGKTSGTVGISVADAAGTWTLKLPTTAGSASQFLQTDGAGNTTWAAGGGGGGGSPGAPAQSYQYNDGAGGDRKSTRLNSSHLGISYAVFC